PAAPPRPAARPARWGTPSGAWRTRCADGRSWASSSVPPAQGCWTHSQRLLLNEKRPLVLRVRKPIPRGDGARPWGGPAGGLQLSPRPHGSADSDGNGERRSTLFAPHCADSDRSGEARVNSGASFNAPVGGTTLWRARGKLAPVRRAAPRP